MSAAVSGQGHRHHRRFGRHRRGARAQLAGKGVWLALAARDLDKLEAVAAECRAKGAEALAMRCDVSVEADCRDFIEETARKYSRSTSSSTTPASPATRFSKR